MNKEIRLMWFRPKEGFNLGDELAPYLVEKLSGKKIKRIELKQVWKEDPGEIFIVVGSIIHYVSNSIYSQKNQHSELDIKIVNWGCGLMFGKNPGQLKLTNLAVRGPLTRKALTRFGHFVGDGLGDPGFLMPKFYNPSDSPSFDIGIIPHIYDYETRETEVSPLLMSEQKMWVDEETKLKIRRLDVREGNIEDFVDQLKSCRRILSASLHGLILAEAYGIPHGWIRFSSTLSQQSLFKYEDFYESINENIPIPYLIKRKTCLRKILREIKFVEPKYFDCNSLLKTCPFIDQSLFPF